MDLSNTLHVFIKVTGNFLKHLKNSFSSKQQVFSEYSKLICSFIFSKSQFFRFSWHIICSVCRMVMIFLLTQRYELRRPSRYLGCVHEAHKKVFGDIRKQFQLNYEQEKELKVSLEYSEKPLVLSWNLFSNASRKFPVNFMNTYNVFKRPT